MTTLRKATEPMTIKGLMRARELMISEGIGYAVAKLEKMSPQDARAYLRVKMAMGPEEARQYLWRRIGILIKNIQNTNTIEK